jgi:hypothetical protein
VERLLHWRMMPRLSRVHERAAVPAQERVDRLAADRGQRDEAAAAVAALQRRDADLRLRDVTDLERVWRAVGAGGDAVLGVAEAGLEGGEAVVNEDGTAACKRAVRQKWLWQRSLLAWSEASLTSGIGQVHWRLEDRLVGTGAYRSLRSMP